jgi:hypothetical protein
MRHHACGIACICSKFDNNTGLVLFQTLKRNIVYVWMLGLLLLKVQISCGFSNFKDRLVKNLLDTWFAIATWLLKIRFWV